MAKPFQGRKGLFIFLAAVLALLLLIYFTSLRENRTPLEDAMLAIFSPAQKVFSSAGRKIQSFFDAIVSFQELKQENERLRRELAFLEGQLLELQELQKENYRYRQLLEFQENSSLDLLPAQVIGRDPSQWFGMITISRGYRDGIRKEMPVITDRGLVGMVYSVSPNSSQVILLTDPRLAVSALIQRSRDPGIVGIVENYPKEPALLRMTNLPPDCNVQPGDTVISSGLGGVFPKGLPIGTVKEVGEDQYGLVKYVVVEPRINFNRLEEVLVVRGSGGKRSSGE
ncbi:MAG TPA: rod shape-determining protein MreC [Bacillota bacterium]|nr:rod shape-determining protein MreC [Bacillota bacterium]HOB87676.1 rod shape-determining protein MreC [Bacillota bacterium]HOP69662.1 rod shape-determining protein MreC [Bacillota bacterium]HPT34555.1 rod shape-determining protein MreC [Bacillota bacterium]HPZ64544.1 rod shape-determining protein MreC [Bacillota bacterium]